MPLGSSKRPGINRIALLQYGGWAMYRGPKFVLYADGLALFQRDTTCWPQRYFAVHLAQQEIGRLTDAFEDGWWTLGRCCHAVGGSDNMATYILVGKDTPKIVSVYGNVSKSHFRSKAPGAFLKVLDRLSTFDDHRARPWYPALVNARLYPQEQPPSEETIIEWPPTWPKPSPGSAGRRDVQLPSSALPMLERMFPGVGKEKPVRVGAAIFHVQYRLEVPFERDIYRAANREPCGVDARSCNGAASAPR